MLVLVKSKAGLNKKETRTRLRGLKAGASMPVFESFPQLDTWLLTSLGSLIIARSQCSVRCSGEIISTTTSLMSISRWSTCIWSQSCILKIRMTSKLVDTCGNVALSSNEFNPAGRVHFGLPGLWQVLNPSQIKVLLCLALFRTISYFVNFPSTKIQDIVEVSKFHTPLVARCWNPKNHRGWT